MALRPDIDYDGVFAPLEHRPRYRCYAGLEDCDLIEIVTIRAQAGFLQKLEPDFGVKDWIAGPVRRAPWKNPDRDEHDGGVSRLTCSKRFSSEATDSLVARAENP